MKPGGNEQTANPSFMPDEYFAHSREIYKPVLDRNMRMAASDRTLRDITAGEEILQDYLAFIGQLSDDWENEVLFLRAQCNGDAGKSKIYYEDALNWFVSRYQDENDIRDELLDVIIMDAM